MSYVYDFDIGSILFFSLTLFFHLYQKRVRSLKDSIFTAMLWCAMVAIVFDFVAAAMERHALAFPVWMLYAVNMLFILAMQTCLPLFLLYAVASAEAFRRFRVRWRVMCALPYIATMLLLLISPFTDFGVCYIDEAHIYRHGPTHIALYINVGAYVLGGLMALFWNRRRVDRLKRNIIYVYAGILFVAIVTQWLFPRYLVTASATALALTTVFYALQSPVDQIDPLTGAFNRTVLGPLLRDYTERGKPYTLLLISLRSFDEFARRNGDEAGNALRRTYAAKIMARFARESVIVMDTSEFIVVHCGVLDRDAVTRLRLQASETVEVDEYGAARADICFGAICQGTDEDVSDVLNTADYMFKEMRAQQDRAVLYADDAYKRGCAMRLQLEASLDRLLREYKLPVMLTPIYDRDGVERAVEARLTAPDAMASHVPPNQLLRAVIQGGHARAHNRALLHAVRERRETLSANRKLCLPLLPGAFLAENALEDMLALVDELGFRPEQILFSVAETEIASYKSALSDRIRRFADCGFSFMLDAFAEGYTDMSFVISLPFHCARLHESIVHNAATDQNGVKLLGGLIGILADVGIQPICGAITDATVRKTALDAGAPLLQGDCAHVRRGV